MFNLLCVDLLIVMPSVQFSVNGILQMFKETTVDSLFLDSLAYLHTKMVVKWLLIISVFIFGFNGQDDCQSCDKDCITINGKVK